MGAGNDLTITGSSSTEGAGNTKAGGMSPEAKAAGSIVNALGSFADGMNQNKSLRYQAAQIDQKANTARAIGSRQLQEMRRKKRQVMSNMTSQIVGGGAAMDANMINMKAKVGARMDSNASMTKWMADTKGQSLDMQAAALRHQAKLAKAKGTRDAISSIISAF